MICNTTSRTLLSLAGSAIMTLGTFSMLKASAPWHSPHREAVSYRDADLAHPEKLYERIEAAAERVCAPRAKLDPSLHPRTQQCVDQAVAAAVEQIDRPQLSTLHSARIGGWQAQSEQQAKPGV